MPLVVLHGQLRAEQAPENVVERWPQKLHSGPAVLEIGT
jgi:hypothetical protein